MCSSSRAVSAALPVALPSAVGTPVGVIRQNPGLDCGQQEIGV